MNPHDIKFEGDLADDAPVQPKVKPSPMAPDLGPGLGNIGSDSDRAGANYRRSQELNGVTFDIPVERENFFALKINGKISTPPTSSRQILESKLLELSEDEREGAVIVSVDANGQELLLG